MARNELTEVSTIDLFGSNRTIIARCIIDGEPARFTLHGTQKGKPGHVRIFVEDQEIPVPFPERYGRAFNEDWVRTYWDRNIKSKEEE